MGVGRAGRQWNLDKNPIAALSGGDLVHVVAPGSRAR
jgi:hypothetical protein